MLLFIIFGLVVFSMPFVYDMYAKKDADFIRYKRGTTIKIALFLTGYYALFIRCSAFIYKPQGRSDFGLPNLRIIFPLVLGMTVIGFSALSDFKVGLALKKPIFFGVIMSLFLADSETSFVVNLFRSFHENLGYAVCTLMIMAMCYLAGLKACSRLDSWIIFLGIVCIYRMFYEIGFLVSISFLFFLFVFRIIGGARYIIDSSNDTREELCIKRRPLTLYIFVTYLICVLITMGCML